MTAPNQGQKSGHEFDIMFQEQNQSVNSAFTAKDNGTNGGPAGVEPDNRSARTSAEGGNDGSGSNGVPLNR